MSSIEAWRVRIASAPSSEKTQKAMNLALSKRLDDVLREAFEKGVDVAVGFPRIEGGAAVVDVLHLRELDAPPPGQRWTIYQTSRQPPVEARAEGFPG